MASGKSSDFVPGESCFNLNFSDPGGNFGAPVRLASPAPSDDGSSSNNSESQHMSAFTPNGLHSPLVMDGSSPGGGRGGGRGKSLKTAPYLPNGKKTKGRVKIKMEFIDNKLRRYTTFSKRKTGIMKKAYELATLTGTQVMLLVASETGHVYTFATKKLQPMITSEAGKTLIQTCLNSPDDPDAVSPSPPPDSATPPTPRAKGKSKANGDHDDASPAKARFFGSSLPTMVPQGFGAGPSRAEAADDGGIGFASDDSDDDDDGGATEASHAPITPKTEPKPDFLLPNALFPQSSSASQFGLVQGNGGAVMYQMPQGVVYAPGGDSAQPQSFMLNLDPNSSAQPQFITIPMGLSMMMGGNGAGGVMPAGGESEESS